MARVVDTKQLVASLRSQGFECVLVNSGHWRVENLATGQRARISATPSSRRTLLNEISRLGRIGYRRER